MGLYNEQMNCLAAELCLANSRNNSLTTKKYIEYIKVKGNALNIEY